MDKLERLKAALGSLRKAGGSIDPMSVRQTFALLVEFGFTPGFLAFVVSTATQFR